MQKKNTDLIIDKITKISQQCVKCGLCLPHCPTYKLNNLEGHSPRGRIALWQNLANQQLTATEKTIDYLEHCLSCGACENNCPAGVSFLELQDLGKNYLLNQTNSNTGNNKKYFNIFINNLIIKLISTKNLNTLLHCSLYFYQKLRLHYITNVILSPMPGIKDKINQLYSLLPNLLAVQKPKEQSKNDCAGYKPNQVQPYTDSVILFSGCMNKIVANSTIEAAIVVLNKLNINVHIVNNLHCCGALYRHNGQFDQANKIISNNITNITKILKNNTNISHIVTIDTGCHPEIVKQLQENKINIKAINLEQYIYKIINNDTSYRGSHQSGKRYNNQETIFIYHPCSQREQLKTPNITKDLLSLILPKANIKLMSTGYGCCGAAGRYMLDHPNTAQKLAMKIIDEFIEQNKEFPKNITLCTSNIGCALHLRNILMQQYNINLEIKHPIELLLNNALY